MSSVKESLHGIIDSIDDEALLESIYEFLETRKDQQPGKIWESLTPLQKQNVLDAERDIIDNPEEHVSHDEMRKRNKRWLEK
ncbi:MAG TPA: hypothetical protein VIN08_23535 [Ohtaekwangia sp.]|uniref:hypothetical protein n=1 Tax=Ohtaekwangia sp. TaxID=2066019 RepID=UPI002F936279